MQPQPWPEPAPEVVRAKHHGRNLPLPVVARDRFGELFPDTQFADAFGVTGPNGWPPGRLALITGFQTAENPTDRQAAEAVRDRRCRAYALGLGPEAPRGRPQRADPVPSPRARAPPGGKGPRLARPPQRDLPTAGASSAPIPPISSARSALSTARNRPGNRSARR